ncbi:hypothetical protein [Pseudomonas gessardii]|uniref:Uncharacterized protein n=1 Tax=Pseudomonas gessardii TaxID=78544 RepID=A0A7Y1MVA8_9PSED|nr:hypothetical protein [Pseudomonas gessardii]MBH3424985.1 hypothetical protein [Pseudomonas gessardii]MCF4980854.1 hypothetical protein [Pseudomonas gessardii]MCF4991199.1 hypothetical protein [Pseudomonas gessardii]MCF5086129.1 hypothetical protein [Pseudomonas gessardii]MCF5097671.1 hypothetical protein [Pseudomonas gessardii]
MNSIVQAESFRLVAQDRQERLVVQGDQPVCHVLITLFVALCCIASQCQAAPASATLLRA